MPTAVQFYAVTRDGNLYAVHSESPKSAMISCQHVKGEWSRPSRRMEFKAALRFSTLEPAVEAAKVIGDLVRDHRNAEQALGRANRNVLNDTIERMAAKAA